MHNPPPTPDEIKEARAKAGLSQQKAASCVQVTLRTWQYWEEGKHRMPPSTMELFRLKTGQATLAI